MPDRSKIKTIKPFRLAGSAIAHYLPPDSHSFPPDLAAVIHAWPALPEAVRAGIAAMARAAAGERGRP